MSSGKPAAEKIRSATFADLPALLPMMRSLAEQPPALPFDDGEVRAALQEFFLHPEFGHAWLICVGEKIAGYVILTLGYSFEYRGRDAFIDELYIVPGFRRMGLARRAMEFVEQQARALGVNAVHLEVDRDNEPALALYRRAAYQNHDRYLMTKWLRPG